MTWAEAEVMVLFTNNRDLWGKLIGEKYLKIRIPKRLIDSDKICQHSSQKTMEQILQRVVCQKYLRGRTWVDQTCKSY